MAAPMVLLVKKVTVKMVPLVETIISEFFEALFESFELMLSEFT